MEILGSIPCIKKVVRGQTTEYTPQYTMTTQYKFSSITKSLVLCVGIKRLIKTKHINRVAGRDKIKPFAESTLKINHFIKSFNAEKVKTFGESINVFFGGSLNCSKETNRNINRSKCLWFFFLLKKIWEQKKVSWNILQTLEKVIQNSKSLHHQNPSKCS